MDIAQYKQNRRDYSNRLALGKIYFLLAKNKGLSLQQIQMMAKLSVKTTKATLGQMPDVEYRDGKYYLEDEPCTNLK